MKTLLATSALVLSTLFSVNSWAEKCKAVLLPQSPSVFARDSLGIQYLAHGTSLASARAAIADRALLSSSKLKKDGSFSVVGSRKPSLQGIFTQAIFKPEWLENVLNYIVSVPLDPQEPDAGGSFETRYFEIIFLFDLRPLDESPFYASPKWSYDPPDEKYANNSDKKIELLKSLKVSDIPLPTSTLNPRVRNEVVFKLPEQGLSFKYLAGIHIHGDADQVERIQSLLRSDLQQAGWSDEEIGKLLEHFSH